MMISMPCQPDAATTDTVGEIFGESNVNYAHFTTASFYPLNTWSSGSSWTILRRAPSQASNTSVRLSSLTTSTMSPGTAYWLLSGTAPTGITGQANGAIGTIPLTSPASTASPLISQVANPRCPSVNGCYELTLTSGINFYNMLGNALPFDVDWADVRVDDGITAYSPSGAETENLMSKTFWIWNGSSYQTADDLTGGTLRVMRSFFVKMLAGSSGKTLKLLIPAKPTLKTSAATPFTLHTTPAQPMPWYLGWLDWLVPAAAAATPSPVAVGVLERDLRVKQLEQALKAKTAWRVQLIVSIAAKGLRDPGNWLGRIPGAKNGFDSSDLPEMAPLTPYLTLVFPHPEWLDQAGNYASDFHHPATVRDAATRTWNFDIRADQGQIGQTVFLSWEGDPAVLKRCSVTDPLSGKVFNLSDPKYRFGMPVVMDSPVQSYIWEYK
jgi:hypothetical protein